MGDVETLARGDDSRLVQPRRFVIRDRQSFTAVHAAHAGQDAAVPAVDFETRMVAAVFAGERPTPGFSVEVIGTRREGPDSRGPHLTNTTNSRPTPHAWRRRRSSCRPITSSRCHETTVTSGSTFPIPADSRRLSSSRKPRARLARTSRRCPRHQSATLDAGDGASIYTGLTPRVAASLAYLAGPLSGALLLATEPASRFVRFHAWQAVLALGVPRDRGGGVPGPRVRAARRVADGVLDHALAGRRDRRGVDRRVGAVRRERLQGTGAETPARGRLAERHAAG